MKPQERPQDNTTIKKSDTRTQLSIFLLRIYRQTMHKSWSASRGSMISRTIRAFRCGTLDRMDNRSLPSGSRSLVTPYSRSATKKTRSSRSRGWLERAVLQSTRSGRFRWRRALKARPSLQEQVKSVTRTPGYRAVDRRAHLRRASRAVTFGSWPTTMSDIWKNRKSNAMRFS